MFFVYKSLAHPEGGSNSYIRPVNLQERLMHVAEAKKTLGATVPWLVDTMDNDLKHALGDRPNSEFIIDPDGKIAVMRDWSRPSELRADLEKLVGKVENPTQVSDLDLKIETTPKPAASGVVERVKSPGQMQALRVVPQEGKHPFYVKLRAEVDQNVLRGREGKMYLGFHLDPLYHVHWNNLAKPLTFEIAGSEGVQIAPGEGTGPKVEVEADIDPREFLVDIEADSGKSFELTVKYFACNDEQGFCIPVTQTYVVHLAQDRDAGNPRRGGGRGGRPEAGRPEAGRPGEGGPPQGNRPPGGFTADRLMQMDRDKDGKLSREELPAQMRERMSRMDTNGDGFVDRKEAEAVEQRFGQQGGPRRRPR